MSIKKVTAEIERTKKEISELQEQLDEKIAELDDINTVVAEDMAGASQIGQKTRDIQAHIDDMGILKKGLDARLTRLENELHELDGQQLVNKYKANLRNIYSLGMAGNKLVEQLDKNLKEIARISSQAYIPSKYHDTKAYKDMMADGWHLPTMPNNIGHVDLMSARMGLYINLPDKAKAMNK